MRAGSGPAAVGRMGTCGGLNASVVVMRRAVVSLEAICNMGNLDRNETNTCTMLCMNASMR